MASVSSISLSAIAQASLPGLCGLTHHPTTPTANLVTYVWYTAMYRQSPVGLQALVAKDDPTSAAREKILQQIAWNAVIGEPKSGMTGAPVKVGS